MLFGKVGLWEILIIAGIVLLIVGPKRVVGLIKGFGKGIGNFRREMRGDGEDPRKLE
jgi:TatA/E family protein of Tat protein translocase